MNASTALKLGRVSNLPTVWTNVLAAGALTGIGGADVRLPWAIAAMSLCYVAGMFLNDAFDRGFDAQHRPERPIPSGEISPATVFATGFGLLAVGVLLLAWTGFAVPQGTGWRPAMCGTVLAAAIVFYDWRHKQNALSPVVMGLCRFLVYVTAGFVFAASPPVGLFGIAALLLSYLIGLTYVARQEHLGRVANLWPLLFVAMPAAWALHAAFLDSAVAAFAILWLGWVMYALSFLRRRRPGDVPRAVGALLAGICLWDAVVIAASGALSIAVLAVALFLVTLLFQRYVAPT